MYVYVMQHFRWLVHVRLPILTQQDEPSLGLSTYVHLEGCLNLLRRLRRIYSVSHMYVRQRRATSETSDGTVHRVATHPGQARHTS